MKLLEALVFASVIAVAGIVYLATAVNAMTGLLALLTLVSYVFLYTPLKRKSSLSTLVGSIPGALPPMGGWVAANGAVTTEAWVLFGILFLWQLPHVLALTWLYREDFARGGFLMLPVMDPEGLYTSRHIIGNCLALLPMSLLPTLVGMTGALYFFGALTLGLGFLGFGIQVARLRSLTSARHLLLASLIYLPVLFCLMSLDKVTL